MGRNALIIGAALAAMLATSASAAVTVLGNGAANQCSAAALAGDATDEDLAVCNQALLEVVSDTEKAGTYVNRGVILLRRKNFIAARTAVALDVRREQRLAAPLAADAETIDRLQAQALARSNARILAITQGARD